MIGLVVWMLQTDPLLIYKMATSISKLGYVITKQSADFQTIIETQRVLVEPIQEAMEQLSWMHMGTHFLLGLLMSAMSILFYLMGATLLVCQMEMVFVMVAGLFTISLIFIPYFKDVFVGYIKGLATAALKCALVSFVLQIIISITQGWPNIIRTASITGEGMVSVCLPMVAAEAVMFMLLKAIPNMASLIMSGQATSLGGGAFNAPIFAAAGAAMSAAKMAYKAPGKAREIAAKTTGVARKIGGRVKDTAASFSDARKSARSNGASQKGAAMTGAKEAMKTFTGINGGRSSGNTMSAPGSGGKKS